jgi:hypothetical protein
MKKRGPFLKNKQNPIISFFRFFLFLLISFFLLPITFFGVDYTLIDLNSKLFEQLVTELPQGNFSLLTSFTLDTIYVWGLISGAFLLGAGFVYFNAAGLITKKLENKSFLVKLALLIIMIFMYVAALNKILPNFFYDLII